MWLLIVFFFEHNVLKASIGWQLQRLTDSKETKPTLYSVKPDKGCRNNSRCSGNVGLVLFSYSTFLCYYTSSVLLQLVIKFDARWQIMHFLQSTFNFTVLLHLILILSLLKTSFLMLLHLLSGLSDNLSWPTNFLSSHPYK